MQGRVLTALDPPSTVQGRVPGQRDGPDRTSEHGALQWWCLLAVVLGGSLLVLAGRSLLDVARSVSRWRTTALAAAGLRAGSRPGIGSRRARAAGRPSPAPSRLALTAPRPVVRRCCEVEGACLAVRPARTARSGRSLQRTTGPFFACAPRRRAFHLRARSHSACCGCGAGRLRVRVSARGERSMTSWVAYPLRADVSDAGRCGPTLNS